MRNLITFSMFCCIVTCQAQANNFLSKISSESSSAVDNVTSVLGKDSKVSKKISDKKDKVNKKVSDNKDKVQSKKQRAEGSLYSPIEENEKAQKAKEVFNVFKKD